MITIHLSLDEVLEIHTDQINRYGGSDGIRDLGLLVSALAQPAMTFAGQLLHNDLFEMAAAYLFHITSNHPFIDGNKRVGVVAALVFLRVNGVTLSANNAELEAMVLGVARGQLRKPEIAAFFRTHATP